MEKYCSSCGRVFKDSDFRICPYCGNKLSSRIGRQPISRQLRHQVFQRDGYRCRECGATNKQTRLHVDHIKPVAKGGTNDLSNLQTLCEDCNRSKYTDEWVGGVNEDRNSVLIDEDFADTFYITADSIHITKNEEFKSRKRNYQREQRLRGSDAPDEDFTDTFYITADTGHNTKNDEFKSRKRNYQREELLKSFYTTDDDIDDDFY